MRTTRIVTVFAATALALAGCSGGGGDAGGDDGGSSASGAITVEAGDLYFEPETLSAAAGDIEVTLVNVGGADHDFVIEEAGDVEVAFATPGETVTGSITLEAGTYTYYCSIPGHRSLMEGTLEVS